MGEEERRRCCMLGGCGCPPPEQAAALAKELGIPEDAALKVVQRFGLVPRNLAATQAAAGSDAAGDATARLGRLKLRVQQELRDILAGLGYGKQGDA